MEYLGNLVCGHRGMITQLKVFGDVLISGSKDGFITIWSATQLVNLSILHYGPNPVLDFTIFPNPYPLCHITIWNEHLNAIKKLHDHQTNENLKQQSNILKENMSTPSPQKRALNGLNMNMNPPPKVITNDDSNPRWPSLPNDIMNMNMNMNLPVPQTNDIRNTQSHNNDDEKAVLQYISLNSLYEYDLPKQQSNKIQDTILGFCGSGSDHDNSNQNEQKQGMDDNILSNEDAPDVLASVFRAAIPSTPGSSNNSIEPPDENEMALQQEQDQQPILPESAQQMSPPIQLNKKRADSLDMNMNMNLPMNINKDTLSVPITSKPSINDNSNERRVLSREIMHNASSHFGSISLILKDLKLIVGGTSGEIHIWHIGNNRSAFNMTTNWERETILRGHGDRVTCLEAFGTHLMSAYSNGSLKVKIYF